MMAASRPKLVYIARAFPPTTGGMEQLALQISTRMQAHADVTPIVNRRGKKGLPLFLPYAFASALARIRRGGVDVVCLSDAALAPLGAELKRATGVPVVTTVHGLDVTWTNAAYQAVVPRALRQLDLALPNSAATECAMRKRTGARPRSVVIPLGVNPLPEPSESDIQEFRDLARIAPDDRILLTVGRLIERKGVEWFAQQVFPNMARNAVYVVIGEGSWREAIVGAATEAGVASRVRLTGRVSDAVLAAAYRSAELFVMPNVPVAGDMEGFGLVALEASASGLPVVAARLEGITEAIHDEQNGLLVQPADRDAWIATVTRLLALPRSDLRALGAAFAMQTTARFGWDRTARRYVQAIMAAAERNGGTESAA